MYIRLPVSLTQHGARGETAPLALYIPLIQPLSRETHGRPQNRTAHEVEPTFAGDVLVLRGPWDFAASLAGSRLLNTHYIPRNTHYIPRNDRWNVNLALSARYHLR